MCIVMMWTTHPSVEGRYWIHQTVSLRQLTKNASKIFLLNQFGNFLLTSWSFLILSCLRIQESSFFVFISAYCIFPFLLGFLTLPCKDFANSWERKNLGKFQALWLKLEMRPRKLNLRRSKVRILLRTFKEYLIFSFLGKHFLNFYSD